MFLRYPLNCSVEAAFENMPDKKKRKENIFTKYIFDIRRIAIKRKLQKVASEDIPQNQKAKQN